MTTVGDRASYGLYADRQCLADLEKVARATDHSTEELLALG